MTKLNLAELKSRFERELARSFEREKFSKDLSQALTYALKSPGKRLRPLIVLASALAQDLVRAEQALSYAMPAALALEYVHTYSLIHDDLPSMDNDDYRRGRLSVHRRFSEALAILAGDALLADAFGFIAQAKNNPALLCLELSQSAGRHNLVGGQVEDLRGQKTLLSTERWLEINAKKTARLFEASAAMGSLSVGQKDLTPMRRFGYNFGVAFQIKDDLDDNARVCDKGQAPLKVLLEHHVEQAHQAAYMSAHPQLLEDLLAIF
jgi:geranylgeranyl diphosphate synthase type II